MTVRFVPCEFCQRLHDFHVMHMCPVCRKTICRVCKHDGPLEAGSCAKKEPCAEAPRGGSTATMSTSPFPRWLHHLDPTLATAGESGLYMTFRERRLTHGRRIRFDFIAAIPWILLLFFLAGLIFGVTAIALGPEYFPWMNVVMLERIFLASMSCFAVAVLLIIIRHFRRGRRSPARILPRSAGRVYTGSRVQSAPAEDLWLCGYGGRHIAEAVYLETWEVAARRVSQVLPVLVVAAIASPVYLLGAGAWTTWLVVLSSVGLAFSMGYAVLGIAPILAATASDLRTNCWLKHLHYGKFLGLALIGTVIGPFLGFALLAAAVYCWEFLFQALEPTSQQLLVLAGRMAVLAVLLAIIPMITSRVGWALRRWVFASADRHYEPMMRKVVFDDPDFDKPIPSPENRAAGS